MFLTRLKLLKYFENQLRRNKSVKLLQQRRSFICLWNSRTVNVFTAPIEHKCFSFIPATGGKFYMKKEEALPLSSSRYICYFLNIDGLRTETKNKNQKTVTT